MSIQSINPYLIFPGTAAQAIALYRSALGAVSEGVMRLGDVPGMDTPPERKDHITHARLTIGGGVVMLSDAMEPDPAAPNASVQVALHFDDVADMTRKFEALAASGKILFPLHQTFWGATFGIVADTFGVRWMFNCEKKAG